MLKKFAFTKKKIKNIFNDDMKDKTNSQKLDIIISEIKTIKTDLGELRDEFVKYKKQDSNFQEIRVNNLIMTLLERNKSSYLINLLPIKYIYTPYSNKQLTELDGLIYYTPNQSSMPPISNELFQRTDKQFQESLKENISQINTTFTSSDLIIVESKRSLSKQKLDAKLHKIYNFIGILSTLEKLNMENTSENFNALIQSLKEYTKCSIQDISLIDIKLIFGSDDIPQELSKYIVTINKGITKEEYDVLCSNLFYSDRYAVEFIKNIPIGDKVTKKVKSLLNNYTSFIELKTIIDTYLEGYDMDIVNDYLTPYEDMEHIFKRMKGKIGIIQFNRAILPELFQFSTINSP